MFPPDVLSFNRLLKRFALHIGRNRNAELLQNGGGHIHQLQAMQFAPTHALVYGGIVLDDDAKLGVIAVIGAGIILKGVDRTMSNGPDRAPEEVAKVDNQVWRHAVTLLIDVLRLVDGGADIDTVGVDDSFQSGFHFVTQCLILGRLDNALRLASFNIEKDTRIVAAIAPYSGLAPIDFALLNRGERGGHRFEGQIALLYEPLVDADTTVHLLGSVIGDDKDGRIIQVHQVENLPNLVVEITVVIVNALIIGGMDFVFMMSGIVILPHTMMNAVGSHLDKHEEVPILLNQPLFDQFEALFSHRINLAQQVVLVIGAEIGHIHQVFADNGFDLLHGGGRIGVWSLRIRG